MSILRAFTNQLILLTRPLRGGTIFPVSPTTPNFSGPVIVVTHAYLSYDGSVPTFGSTFPAGSAYPLCSGFPGSVYGCRPDSLANYNPVGGGNDGIGLWYKLIGTHPNVFKQGYSGSIVLCRKRGTGSTLGRSGI